MYYRKTVSMSKGLPAQLHQAASEAQNCHPALEGGKLERSLVSAVEALPNPASPATVHLEGNKDQGKEKTMNCHHHTLISLLYSTSRMTHFHCVCHPHPPTILASFH